MKSMGKPVHITKCNEQQKSLVTIEAIRSMSVTLCRPCEAVDIVHTMCEDLQKCAV
jgi:hypothetical protein